MKLPLSVLIASLLLIFPPLYSQQKWRHLTTEDGLSDNKILTIYQAENSHIWIGTDKGVNRYNGIFEESSLSGSVNSILESPSGQIIAREVSVNNAVSINLFDGLEWDEPDFFADNDITVAEIPQFFVVSGGKFWLSVWYGLVSFDGVEWKLSETDVDTDWLVQTPDGRLWSESWQQDGIISFNGQKWNLEFNTDNSLIDGVITNTVLATSNGMILLGTDEGLFQYDPILNIITDLKLGKVNVGLIYESTEQSLWIGTNKGLFRFDNGKWQGSITDQIINTIQQTDQGQLWVGTSDGLYRFQNGEWISELDIAVNCFTELSDGTFLVGGNDGLRMKSLADETVAMKTLLPGKLTAGLFLASNGTLWCRSTAGILSYNGLEWTNHGYQEPNSPSYFWEFTNIYEDRDGTIWFSNTGGSVLNYKDGTLESHSVGGWTYGIAESSDGRIGVSGWTGPYIYDGDVWTTLTGYGTAQDDNRNFGLYLDEDGLIWVNGNQGMWLYEDGNWTKTLDSSSKPIDSGTSFLRDPDGTLWAGAGAGIYRLNTEKKWEKSVNVSGGGYQATGGGFLPNLHLTMDGTLIAISRNGLLIYDGKQWSKHPSYSLVGSDVLCNDHFAHGFVEYPQGVFWLATTKGLRRIQGNSWYDLTVADGLPSNDVYTVELDNSNNLWVGTTQGLARFTPPSNPNPPGIQLTQIDRGTSLTTVFMKPFRFFYRI